MAGTLSYAMNPTARCMFFLPSDHKKIRNAEVSLWRHLWTPIGHSARVFRWAFWALVPALHESVREKKAFEVPARGGGGQCLPVSSVNPKMPLPWL